MINITSSGLPTVTQQPADGSAREFIYNGILPERNYTIEVKGYVHWLGPADTTTIRLKGILTKSISHCQSGETLRGCVFFGTS